MNLLYIYRNVGQFFFEFWYNGYMKTLFINTSSNAEVVVGVFIDGSEYFLKEEMSLKRSQVVLPLIEKILKEYGILPSELDGIEVHKGPGSFTGIRVGLSVAHALGFALGIPVNGGYEQVEGVYTDR